MGVKLELSGRTFGKLTVIGAVGIRTGRSNRSIYWLCECDCGKRREVQGNKLKSGHTRSCGCIATEKINSFNRTHGMSRLPSYKSWCMMMNRCFNRKDPSFHHYGGRGITVCERWLDFENFRDDMGERQVGLTLERINNEKGYEPSNCKWATRKEQSNNMRRNKNYEQRYGK